MNEQKPKDGQIQQLNDTEGFKFAVTLLAALGTILYAVYTYLQTTPVDPLGYLFISGLITVGIILIIILILYILIKGYSIEVGDTDRKNMLNERAKTIYLIIFPSFVALIMCISWLFFTVYVRHTFGLDKTWFTLILSLSSLVIAWVAAYIVLVTFYKIGKLGSLKNHKPNGKSVFGVSCSSYIF